MYTNKASFVDQFHCLTTHSVTVITQYFNIFIIFIPYLLLVGSRCVPRNNYCAYYKYIDATLLIF